MAPSSILLCLTHHVKTSVTILAQALLYLRLLSKADGTSTSACTHLRTMALTQFTTVLLFASALGALSDCENESCTEIGPQADGSMLLQAQVLAPDAVDPIEEKTSHNVAEKTMLKNMVTEPSEMAAGTIHEKMETVLSEREQKKKRGASEHVKIAGPRRRDLEARRSGSNQRIPVNQVSSYDSDKGILGR